MRSLIVISISIFTLIGCASKGEVAKAEFESVLKDSGYFHCPYEDMKVQDGEYVKYTAYTALIFDKPTHELAVLRLSEPSTEGYFEKSNITDAFISGYSVRGDKNKGSSVNYYRNTSNMNLDYVFRMSGTGEAEGCEFIEK
ncbi:TPA: hypothetical protein ACX3FA_004643 [Vibrio parahaemolyticus]